MDLQNIYDLVVNMTVAKRLMAICAINLSLYYFFARKAKKELALSGLLHNKNAVLKKVVELKNQGDKRARIAYFFYCVSVVNLAICFCIVPLVRFS